ncbi:MAG: M1 family metallopeptidase [Acidimicrobiales bacterium]
MLHRRSHLLVASSAWLLVASVVAGCADTDSDVTASGAAAIGSTVPDPAEPLPATTDGAGSTDTTDAEAPPTTVDDTVPETTTSATPPRPDTGDGIGDELYPSLGNPGLDVQDYVVDIDYDPTDVVISGSVTLTIEFTEDRDEFTLDSSGPEVSRVTIDGDEVAFEADDPELRITPDEPIESGDTHEVSVEYTAAPDGGSSESGLPSGWFPTARGSYVLNEPDGARTWLPSNDHPSDKATWTFRVTVPTGQSAIANGDLVGTTTDATGDTWEWREDDPMTTYLVLLVTGPYQVIEGTTAAGLDLLSVALDDQVDKVQPMIDGIGDQIDFFDDFFGPYPFDQYGLAVIDSPPGLAMETLGRSFFSTGDLNTAGGYIEQLLLSHELAHMWFGDAVSPARWIDIWLNESFATYAQWMWLEHLGFTTVDSEALNALGSRQGGFGDPTGSPTASSMFAYNAYDGGAVVLHALRRTIGDEAFFETLRTWAQDNYGTSRTSADFIAHVEAVSGQQLDDFFQTWLYADELPGSFPDAAA